MKKKVNAIKSETYIDIHVYRNRTHTIKSVIHNILIYLCKLTNKFLKKCFKSNTRAQTYFIKRVSSYITKNPT